MTHPAEPAVEPAQEISDAELIAFAVEEEFILFCDEDSFIQIARGVLHRFGRPRRATPKTWWQLVWTMVVRALKGKRS